MPKQLRAIPHGSEFSPKISSTTSRYATMKIKVEIFWSTRRYAAQRRVDSDSDPDVQGQDLARLRSVTNANDRSGGSVPESVVNIALKNPCSRAYWFMIKLSEHHSAAEVSAKLL
jgi:hypothetical protein